MPNLLSSSSRPGPMTSFIPARFALIPVRLRHVPRDIELAPISGNAVTGPVSAYR